MFSAHVACIIYKYIRGLAARRRVLIHHHHYVSSVVNRSAVSDLHRSRSCATLIQSLYDIFVHSLMLSVHIVLSHPVLFYHLSFLPSAIILPRFLLLHVQNIDISFFS